MRIIRHTNFIQLADACLLHRHRLALCRALMLHLINRSLITVNKVSDLVSGTRKNAIAITDPANR